MTAGWDPTEDRWPTELETVLAALYLGFEQGSCTPPRARAGSVISALRRRQAGLDRAAQVLLEAGLPEEAYALSAQGLLENAADSVSRSRVLTAAARAYPRRWTERLLSPPPALWLDGAPWHGRFIAVVGSRSPHAYSALAARELGQCVARMGLGLISGGAKGVDSAAAWASARAGGHATEILPFALDRHASRANPGARLSLCAPGEGFSAGRAMERNLLIYAAAEAAIVIQPRFREGGAWHGASEALRRRLCPVLVMAGGDPRAEQALRALGARMLAAPQGLEEAISAATSEGRLFHPDSVMERRAAYAA